MGVEFQLLRVVRRKIVSPPVEHPRKSDR